MRFKTIGRRLRPAPVTLRTRAARWLMLLAGACVDMWQCRRAAVRRCYNLTTRPATSALDEPWPTEQLERMSPRRFEMLMQLLFERRGSTTSARARSNSGSSDSGLDIWIYRPGGGGPPMDLVQCRHWPARRIGVDQLLPLWALMRRYSLQRGRLATCATFTEEAVAFALDHGIELLDAEVLAEMILANPPARLLMEPALKPAQQMMSGMVGQLGDGAVPSAPAHVESARQVLA